MSDSRISPIKLGMTNKELISQINLNLDALDTYLSTAIVSTGSYSDPRLVINKSNKSGAWPCNGTKVKRQCLRALHLRGFPLRQRLQRVPRSTQIATTKFVDNAIGIH